MALVAQSEPAHQPTQVWGMARKSGATTLSFTILASRHAIAHALVIKSALSVAELAGYTDLLVAVSSIGDTESRRRFQRELGSFFKKNAHLIEPELGRLGAASPEAAYKEVLSRGGELATRLPKPIDSLSENSRKTMVDSLHLFESLKIQYQLEAHLPSTSSVHAELLFAVSGVNKKGAREVIATGGRLDELMKKREKSPIGHAVGMSLTVPEQLDISEPDAELSCFVVHVGDAAKLKAFTVMDALWRANIAVQEALMADSMRDQMDRAKKLGAKYIAIIGQREALDNTVIVRNVATGIQGPIPLDKLAGAVSRATR